MIRIQYALLALFVAFSYVLMPLEQAGAQDKEIGFNKDIRVMPVNDNKRTRITISLGVDKKRVKPGDKVMVSFEADRDCYLALIDVGTSGKITRLWPNQFSGSDNFVRAHKRYSFPARTDPFVFKVSGPPGIERVLAVASTERNRILRDNEFGDYQKGFKSYHKNLKDLVVEAAQRTDNLPQGVKWGTAEVKLVIGNVPDGGRITSRNVYLVCVGVATGSLRYCGDDARGFAQLVANRLRIPRENTLIVLGNKATKAGFCDAMRWLARKTQPEDLVFIYFSGHGTQIKDQPPRDEPDGLDEAFVCYFSRPTLRPDDPDLKNILLVDDEFARLLKNVPARRRVVCVDSCHSGTISKEFPRNFVSKYLPLLSPAEIKELQVVSVSAPGSGGPRDMTDSKETLVAACADSESSYEDRSKKAGLFTYWLLRNIRNGSLDLQTAFDKTRKEVIEETSPLTNRQTPQLTDRYGLARDIKF